MKNASDKLLHRNLKTKKNAYGKRPQNEAHGPGDETIRPQRSSEAESSSEKKVHAFAPLRIQKVR